MKSIRKIKNKKLRVLVFVVLIIIVAMWFFMRIKSLTGSSMKEMVSESLPATTATETKTTNANTATATASFCGAEENTTVTRVIDGDTVEVKGDFRVRLLEIDTPEFGKDCFNEAKDELEKLILNKEIRLEKDNTDVDKYGRCLRYIFLDGKNINLKMVQDGFAKSDIFETDTKYKTQILSAQSQAKSAKTGCLWKD